MIPIVKPFLPPKDKLMSELEKVLYSGYIAQGSKVEEFERQLSDYFETDKLLTLNSGTAALHLALLLSGVKPDDEVISTPVTAEPTNTTIALCGAKVVFADVEESSGLISPKSIKEKITDRTKAIVVVHYAGMVADMESIYDIAHESNIVVIEDCAHALGAKYKNRKLGYFSDFAVYSFQAIKHLTTIDGGLLIAGNQADVARAKRLRWFGLDKSVSREENNIIEAGYKYHMNDVNATIGLCQLDCYNENVLKYIENGRYFDSAISNPKITIPIPNKWTESSYWLYTLLVDDVSDFNKYLFSHGIASSQLHKRNDSHDLFQSSNIQPGVDSFYERFTHIGCGPWVEKDRERIAKIINNY